MNESATEQIQKSSELIDRIAAGAPIGKLLFIESLGNRARNAGRVSIAAGVMLGAIVIAAWNAWRQYAANKEFIAACLAKDQAAAMYRLGRTADADIYASMEIRRNAGVHD